MIDPSWSKWFARSVFYHLETDLRLTYPDLVIMVDGMPDRPADREQQRVELRMDGPFFTPLANSQWHAQVEINVLITSLVGESNIYRHREIRGYVEKTMSKSICLYKYGDGDVHFGTLKVGRVVASYLGRIEADTVIEQSVVEAAATCELTGVDA